MDNKLSIELLFLFALVCLSGIIICHDGLGTKDHHLDSFVPKIHWGLNWLNQWDPRLIKFIREELLISPPSPKQKLNLQNEFDPMKPWQHQGQYGETLAIESLYGLNKVENNKRNTHKKVPFFIEAGALDGETISNTLYFEIKYNWTGLLVEPNPKYLSSLIRKRRNTWILPYCLSPIKAPIVVDFDAIGEYGGIINNKNGLRRLPGNINSNNSLGYLGPSWRKTIKVQCFPVYSVLRALNLPSIDYFSLDIEGAEYQVLNTIPLQMSRIKLFGIETAHAGNIFDGTEKDISNLLYANGYEYVARSKLDKFFKKVVEHKTYKRRKIISIM